MRSRALSLAALAYLVGLLGVVIDIPSARAQNLDAGKSAGQIFSSTCSACHRSARGLVKSVAPGSLPGFLRQHYTTSNEMASVMAAYVMGSGGTDRVAEPPSKREPKQKAAQQPETPEATAARLQAQQERRERAKADRQKAAKKGRGEPAETAKPADEANRPEPADIAKPDAPAAIPGESPVTEPAEAATPAAPAPQPATASAPPAALPARTGIVLPGFPLPEGVPEPSAQTAPSPSAPPSAPTPSPASEVPAPAAPPSAATTPVARPDPALAPAGDGPKTDIMQEEVHTPRPVPAAPRKKRAAE